MIRAGELKQRGAVKSVTEHDATGQPSAYKLLFNIRFGVINQVISETNQPDNSGDKNTLSLFSRYDTRLNKTVTLFIADKPYSVSQIENVNLANRRINFTATEI
jgi:hypothetical protein